MKLFKNVLAVAVVGLITVSCAKEKKEEATAPAEEAVVEEVVEVTETVEVVSDSLVVVTDSIKAVEAEVTEKVEATEQAAH